MANTNSTRKTTTMCQPSADAFAWHHDVKSRMSLLRYAEHAWPANTDDSSEMLGMLPREAPVGPTHVAATKRFGKIILAVMLVTAAFVAISSLRGTKYVAAINFEVSTHSKGHVS